MNNFRDLQMFTNLFQFIEDLICGNNIIDFLVFKSVKLIKYAKCHHI